MYIITGTDSSSFIDEKIVQLFHSICPNHEM